MSYSRFDTLIADLESLIPADLDLDVAIESIVVDWFSTLLSDDRHTTHRQRLTLLGHLSADELDRLYDRLRATMADIATIRNDEDHRRS